nr:DUF4301 family protein [Desulfobacterales bacterium]
MGYLVLRDEDLDQIRALGITEEHVMSQIELFKKGGSYLTLVRPCTIGDGIQRIPESEFERLIGHHQEAADTGRLMKFVPASGAASRMFKVLLWFKNSDQEIDRNHIAAKADEGDTKFKDILSFMDGIKDFAFFDDLKSVMARDGLDTDRLVDEGRFTEILEYLLTSKGLNYASLPKGLIRFHRYPNGNRTAFEEHLVEAANYVKDRRGMCRLHFTVRPEHLKEFKRLLEKVGPRYEKEYNVRFQVDFSLQKRSTDTIAVDLEDKPFRLEDGTLLFRPGGHGALIENLNDLKGDVLYIKNIDNVVPDRLKDPTFLWKRILGGYLLELQKRIFGYLERITGEGAGKELIEESLSFAKKNLHIEPPEGQKLESEKEKLDFLLSRLNRPLRVCGMVKNVGEPGGGPFWVMGEDGALSLQIVESAQVDPESEEQQSILSSATHFNPVDIVCGVRDYRGNHFDLRRYVDTDAVFISRKTKDGRDLKALELPGLWNGAMADWITVFVEVPIITFNPVKTINDLLRDEHKNL